MHALWISSCTRRSIRSESIVSPIIFRASDSFLSRSCVWRRLLARHSGRLLNEKKAVKHLGWRYSDVRVLFFAPAAHPVRPPSLRLEVDDEMAIYNKVYESHPVAIGKAISKMERCVSFLCAS